MSKGWILGAFIGLILIVSSFAMPQWVADTGISTVSEMTLPAVILAFFGIFVFFASVGVVKG